MKCEICGKEIERSFYSHKNLCSGKCFTEDFWNDCLDDEAIIINGACYHDGGKAFCGGERGFNGHVFRIRKNDGTLITTDNLRFNGIVPKERNIPDNACFVEEI